MTRPGRVTRRLWMSLFVFLSCLAWHADAIAAQLTLTWVDAATNEVGVSIERSVGSTGAFSEIDITGPGVTTYVDSGLGTTRPIATASVRSMTSATRIIRTRRVAPPAGLRARCAEDGSWQRNRDQCAGRNQLRSELLKKLLGGNQRDAERDSGSRLRVRGVEWRRVLRNRRLRFDHDRATTVKATFNTGDSTTSFSDDFERPDSTVLGRGWVEAQGNVLIVNGKLSEQHQQDAAPRGAEFRLVGCGARRRRIHV